MSTGKRLAKRSILGTRVCASQQDGRYYSGVIQATKTSSLGPSQNIYTVLFDENQQMGEYSEYDLIGPGFQGVSRIKLKPGQRAYVTYNGREVCGTVVYHRPQIDEVVIRISGGGVGVGGVSGGKAAAAIEMKRRIDDVRLLESRKCARFQGQDTDFARLADVGLTLSPAGSVTISGAVADNTSGSLNSRKRQTVSHTIDVPNNHQWSRKRRPSSPDSNDMVVDTMNDCTAALVLMSLSCSPKSPKLPSSYAFATTTHSSSSDANNSQSWTGPRSWASSSSGASSWDNGPDRSPVIHESGSRSTPSPPSPERKNNGSRLSESAPAFVPSTYIFLEGQDEGIDMDEEDTTKLANTKTVFKCTWPGCNVTCALCETIEKHVREQHLCKTEDVCSDGEEEFYYTELEVNVERLIESFPNICASSPPPTLSHMDMARSPFEDPVYQKSLQMKYSSAPISIPNHTHFTQSSPGKQSKLKSSVHKGGRGRSESRKCRKVYGMDNKDLWCTQCKWKKACSRFNE